MPAYLDVAANAHGWEKALFTHRALERVSPERPHLVEIGPGGGSAVSALAKALHGGNRRVDLTLVEVPGVTSRALTAAIKEFARVGHCTLLRGHAQEIDRLLERPADVVAASALMHEVYSYGGGYAGIHNLMRALPGVLAPGGFFAYRDVYAVGAPSLHERTTHTYNAPSWLRFLRMFTPRYLSEGVHPYHHAQDEVVARQDSRIVAVADLAPARCAVVSAPIGLFREIQRHYLTFRDHAWRSGALGFVPVLDGHLAADWLDTRTGHKRVHYTLTGADWLPRSQRAMLLAVSEPYADHYAVDGDIFDECTDIALAAFLDATGRGDTACAEVWESWAAREGRETYAYLTLDELITAFAVHSTEADNGRSTVLLPARVDDIALPHRNYYNRYLSKRLANPLVDAKQLVLFSHIDVADSEMLGQAMAAIGGVCGKHSLARIYAALNPRG
ncbi:hypothetical protein ACFPZ0_05455 [Streptomonospora nanhaiensis]|uniref:Methyltransferase n=1 Tax=Streptomonospora nanhaiensis TaxID=1323731 RepID=A0A853BNT8_9ACTN|nr:hypothetical protein [Streptomonospora nanhaiensis]MBV2365120.1 class I SAM-dependent methyltransferase [Streptomonospora nanhaiensis]MBX9388221.1 class I SAM-dependent methyltransferase [Streptomonospora nanhaiensis]NYI96670.1 hypothetical protein [Streptomonospora nanhaiensis]